MGSRPADGLNVFRRIQKSGVGCGRLRSLFSSDKGFSELAFPILDIARKVINLCGKTVDGKCEASFRRDLSHYQEYNHVGIYRDRS